MRAVVGAPGGNKSDEAERTPRADVQGGQAAGQGSPTGQEPQTEQASQAEPATEREPAPGFGERGRMRRRARFLRKARELAYRDLGGLVFDLHRFGQRNDPLVLAKLATLREIDTELRGLESGLRDHRPVTVLREVGIAACPRCAAIHGSDDRFCPGCGLAFAANADRPISTAPVTSQVHTTTSQGHTTPSQVHTAPAPAQTPPAAAPTAAAAASISASDPASGAPTLRPTASPVAAKPNSLAPALPDKQAIPAPTEATPAAAASATKPDPGAHSPRPRAPETKTPERTQEDEPTQILRPPRGDADA